MSVMVTKARSGWDVRINTEKVGKVTWGGSAWVATIDGRYGGPVGVAKAKSAAITMVVRAWERNTGLSAGHHRTRASARRVSTHRRR